MFHSLLEGLEGAFFSNPTVHHVNNDRPKIADTSLT